MSLVGTLAKVAIGVAAAKGIGYVVSQRNAGGAGQAPDGGLLSGLGASPPAGSPAPGQPNILDQLSGMLGGSQGGGGLGGLLEQLAQATGPQAGAGQRGAVAGSPGGGSGSGLEQILGGLAAALGGAAQQAGAAPAPTPAAAQGGGSFSDILNQSLRQAGEPKVAPAPHHEAAAGLMLKAMLQAAKCDGRLDEAEKQKLFQAVGEPSREDMAFVNRELAAPVDVQGLARQVPKGLEQQVYVVSVMAIDLDNQAEAQYLADLSQALGLQPAQVNAIHAKLGAPALFS